MRNRLRRFSLKPEKKNMPNDDDEVLVEVAFDVLPDHFALYPWDEAPEALQDVVKDMSPRAEKTKSGWIFFVPRRYVEGEVARTWLFDPLPAVVGDIDGIGSVGWLP